MLTRRDVRDLMLRTRRSRPITCWWAAATLSVAVGAGCAAATAVLLVHTVWSDGMGMP